jgi:uncharacterized membrane protein
MRVTFQKFLPWVWAAILLLLASGYRSHLIPAQRMRSAAEVKSTCEHSSATSSAARNPCR